MNWFAGDSIRNQIYFSSKHFESEWELLWPKVWLLAGVSSDIAQIGRYFKFEFGRYSYLIHRDAAMKLQVMDTVCTSCGCEMKSNDFGNMSEIQCPHPSQNQTQSQNQKKQEVVRNLAKNISCEEKYGLVFITMNPNPDPIEKSIGIPPHEIEPYQIEKMKVIYHVRGEVAANWKLGMDSLLETYHVNTVHPQMKNIFESKSDIQIFQNGASRMIVTINPYAGSISASEKRARAQEYQFKHYDQLNDSQLVNSWATSIFPSTQMSLHPEGVVLMRFIPHSQNPELCDFDLIILHRPVQHPSYVNPTWLGAPHTADFSGRNRPAILRGSIKNPISFGLVLDQDLNIISHQQRAVKSRSFQGPIWSNEEARLKHFYQELSRYLRIDEMKLQQDYLAKIE